MIISHRHRCICFYPPYVPGEPLASVFQALFDAPPRQDAATDDAPGVVRPGFDGTALPSRASPSQAKALLDPATWNEYLKVAFVRNPWDLLVAAYLSHEGESPVCNDDDDATGRGPGGFEDYLLSLDASLSSQTDLLCDGDGELLVDIVGRFEDPGRAVGEVAERLGLPDPGIGAPDRWQVGNYAQYYNALTRDLVADRFQADLGRFAYRFESVHAAPGSAAGRFSAPDHLIVHFSHHKAGTVWVQRVLKHLAARLGWRFQSCRQDELRADSDIFMQENSRVDLARLPRYRGSHIIRDPRDMVVSGYFYHLWCEEPWCLQPRDRFDGNSYQAALNSVSRARGIEMEIENCRSTFERMAGWNYHDPQLLEIRFEDLLDDQYAVFRAVFEHYGLSASQVEAGLALVEQFDFERTTGRPKGEEAERSHLRKGVAGDWRNHFEQAHIDEFKRRYPALLTQLGYEKDDAW